MSARITRRAFFQHTTLGVALLAAARRASAADGMFVSLNGALTPGVSGTARIRLAAATGYGGVDWDLDPAKAAGVDTMRALFSDLKIRPAITNLPMARPLPFGGDDDAFRHALTQLAEDAAFTAAIGCTKMMVVIPAATSLSREDQLALARRRVAAVAKVLQRSNIRLGLEFLGPLYMRLGRPGGPPSVPFIWNLPDTLALAKDTGPNVGALVDAWHWYHSGGTTADLLAADQSRIVHIHVSDAKNTPAADVRDNQRLMPGEGVIDLVGFFQALRRIGYTGGVSPEPLGRLPPDMTPADAARLGLETTIAVMKKAGVAIRPD
jgi:sugar phosphate isomerase/epimerase